MDYMTVREASALWGISERRIQILCKTEAIPGVIRFNQVWAIPKEAAKPVDRRIKSGKYIKGEERIDI